MDEKKKGKSIETKKITCVSKPNLRLLHWWNMDLWENHAKQGRTIPTCTKEVTFNTFISFMKVNSVYTSQSSQPAAVARGLVPLAMATDEMNFETSTASLLTTLEVATSSKHFQVKSLFSRVSICLTSSSSNLTKHSSKISWSASENIFLTFRVKLWTAWFQCPLVFLSKAGKIIGSITLRFCVIKFLMWSLFHKNKVRSATCHNTRFHMNNPKFKSKSFRWSRNLVNNRANNI